MHCAEVVLAVDPRHEGALLEPDPVLAGKRAAELDHSAQHLLARVLDLVQHFGVAHVEQDVGV